MTTPLAYRNGEFKPVDQIGISLHDAGFLWGATITDRIRTFGGKLFLLDEHLQRFRESCRLADIPLPETDATLADVSERLAAENRADQELAVIWVATPGVELPPHSGNRVPTRIAYTQPIRLADLRTMRQAGIVLRTVPATLGVDPRIKHRSRLAWWIAQRGVCETDPDAEPLFVDPVTDSILETPTANIVLVFDGKLVAPPPGTILEGVSLMVVGQLAVTLGIPLERRPVSRKDIEKASEVLLTNTTICVAAVRSVDQHAFPVDGAIHTSLRDAWQSRYGVSLLGELAVQTVDISDDVP